MLLDYTIKCIRHTGIKLSGVWPVKDQLLSFSYVNAHFIMLNPVTDMSKLCSQGTYGMPRNQQVSKLSQVYFIRILHLGSGLRSLSITVYTVSQKTAKLFLSSLLQISTNFDNFWQKDGKEARIVRGSLIFHLSYFASPHYRVKCRCSKLLHNAESCQYQIAHNASSIPQRAPRDLVSLFD